MDFNKVLELVYQAREIIFSKELNTQVKNDNPNDFVTAVDIGISDFLKEELGKLFPDVGFMTEEESEHVLKEKSFIVDPIDGTTNLIYDYHMSAISLAYQENNDVKFGVVFNPFTNEMFFAVKGKGAHYYKTDKGIKKLLSVGVENHEKDKLSVGKRKINRSIIEFGATVSNKKLAKKNFKRARRIFENCLDLRRTCCTALALSYIAAGRIDGYFEISIKPWDYAAGILILAEAGGKSSDWKGNPLPLDRNGSIICSNSYNYDDLIRLVNK